MFRSRDMGRAVAVRRWTPTALDCYKRGCNCEGCFYKDFFSGSSQKCQMKASVLELVRVLGTPNVELQQVISDEYYRKLSHQLILFYFSCILSLCYKNILEA